MLVSTKGRYALSVMIDLAEHNSGEYIPLTDIAERQSISEKYLESIVSMLSRSGELDSLRGKGGGYRLNRQPERYTVLEILECVEKSLSPVSNIPKGGPESATTSEKVMNMWDGLAQKIREYLGSITIDELTHSDEMYDFVI